MKLLTCSHTDHEGDKSLPCAEFSEHPKTKSGYQSICKVCNRKLAAARSKKLTVERQKERGKDISLDYVEDKPLNFEEPYLDFNDPFVIKDA